MNELKYAIDCKVELDLKEFENGMIQVSWADGKCVEIISKETAEKLGLIKEEAQNDFSYLMNHMPSNALFAHKTRLINFLNKHEVGKVYDCELRMGNGDIVGTVHGTKGTFSLAQHTTLSSTGKQFFRMKVSKI
ncbi:hypothetical protein ABE073_04150 [Lederbergia citrisecunda]|uniref:hypothetical protein n=1 Tax=Lederbergia citrisecunda TaxID=2833583 RepID=UPI003D26F4F7